MISTCIDIFLLFETPSIQQLSMIFFSASLERSLLIIVSDLAPPTFREILK